MGLFSRGILFLFTGLAFSGFCKGAVYKVGDSDGWTITGNVIYNKWASSNTFQVGDILLFQYDPRDHNVLQVRRSDFHKCDSTASGNDSIVIRRPGHYYFICGFVGHCQGGQRVDIRAIGPASSPIQAPHILAGPLAPSPLPNSGGESHLRFNIGLLLYLGFVLRIYVFRLGL